MRPPAGPRKPRVGLEVIDAITVPAYCRVSEGPVASNNPLVEVQKSLEAKIEENSTEKGREGELGGGGGLKCRVAEHIVNFWGDKFLRPRNVGNLVGPIPGVHFGVTRGTGNAF